MAKYNSRIRDPLNFRLTGKIGALLGAGVGYLGGLVSGTVKDILLNKLPYLTSNPDIKIFFDSFAYGNKVAGEIALIGLGLGYTLTKLYERKIEEHFYEEEVE